MCCSLAADLAAGCTQGGISTERFEDLEVRHATLTRRLQAVTAEKNQLQSDLMSAKVLWPSRGLVVLLPCVVVAAVACTVVWSAVLPRIPAASGAAHVYACRRSGDVPGPLRPFAGVASVACNGSGSARHDGGERAGHGYGEQWRGRCGCRVGRAERGAAAACERPCRPAARQGACVARASRRLFW